MWCTNQPNKTEIPSVEGQTKPISVRRRAPGASTSPRTGAACAGRSSSSTTRRAPCGRTICTSWRRACGTSRTSCGKVCLPPSPPQARSVWWRRLGCLLGRAAVYGIRFGCAAEGKGGEGAASQRVSSWRGGEGEKLCLSDKTSRGDKLYPPP